MPIKTEMDKNSAVLICNDSLSIAGAAALRDDILQLKAEIQDIRVDFSGVTDMDLSTIQIFCAANRMMEKSGRKMVIKGEKTELIDDTLVECGYDNNNGCPENPCENCFWKGVV